MSRSSRQPEYEATVNVSFELAVDAPKYAPHFHKCHRNGEKKRILDSPTPEHYFHLQYQLLPKGYGEEEGRGGMSKTDVVTFGVVSKVYTEKDTRVVQCWEEVEESGGGEEEEREGEPEEEQESERCKRKSHFGWRHKHSFKVTRDLLLSLYDHTLEIRLWNTKDKLAPRARFDRPRAFRLPIPKKTTKGEALVERPEKFSVVGQQMERTCQRGKRRAKITKGLSVLSSLSEGESDLDLSISISEIPPSPTKPAASLDHIPEGEHSLLPTDQSVPSVTTDDHSEPLVTDESQMTIGVPQENRETSDVPIDMSAVFSSPLALQGMSKSKVRQMEAEAAERARVEREGVVVLHLRMADLFGKRDIIATKLNSPTDNIRAFEVEVGLESPLMPESLRRDLNPTVVTVERATNLPTLHIPRQREICDPVYVKYQFYNLPGHCTTGYAHSRDITWNDSHVILLGTIDCDLLVEYLRGPPLVMEVHDRDRCTEKAQQESTFGTERRDELLGTHAFGTGVKVSEMVRGLSRPWDSFGIACFNLDGLLDGHRTLQLTVPITTGPRVPPSREDCRIGPHGRELPSPLPPGEYLEDESYLTISVELSHPLTPPSIPSHTLTTGTTSPEAPLTTPTTTCPFTRLVYITSTDDAGLILIRRILNHVNDNNTTALGLAELPEELLKTALSTYKLTKSEAEGDVVTGFQVRDKEVSVLVLEGLRVGAIQRMWTQLPRHASQDPGLVKAFYNSGYWFSQRLYGSLDVDLPLIFLPHSLSSLTTLPLLYVRGTVTPAALRALLCLSEMVGGESGGMAGIVRNNLFPRVEEVSALALQFGLLPGDDGIEDSKAALSDSHISIPPYSHTPIPPSGEGKDGRRERIKTKVPLNMSNHNYEQLLNDRKRQSPVDHIGRNITHTQTLSEQSAKLSANRRRHRVRRRAQTDSQSVHIYSSQTLNSAVLAKSRMRAELAASSGHTHQLYTYCQDYHSITFEPVDIDSEKKTERLTSRSKWRTKRGFVYPGVPSTRESNIHPHRPHSRRIQELHQPFTDGLLHTIPSVDRLHFSWEQRKEDFDLYSRLPQEFGPPLPISIHLAGQRRAEEVKQCNEKYKKDWEERVVVTDTRFHTYRRGVCGELHVKSDTQTKRLENILKDSPQKYSLRREGLRLEPIPSLDVVQDCDPYDDCTLTENWERRGEGGYQPGSNNKGSLKRDGNVVPLHSQRSRSYSDGWRKSHDHNFRLFYHTHLPLSKRAILPLSPSEKTPPLFTAPSVTN